MRGLLGEYAVLASCLRLWWWRRARRARWAGLSCEIPCSAHVACSCVSFATKTRLPVGGAAGCERPVDGRQGGQGKRCGERACQVCGAGGRHARRAAWRSARARCERRVGVRRCHRARRVIAEHMRNGTHTHTMQQGRLTSRHTNRRIHMCRWRLQRAIRRRSCQRPWSQPPPRPRRIHRRARRCLHGHAPVLARQSRLRGATDLTQHGEGRASSKAFLTHQVANISTTIQAADANAVLNAASARLHISDCAPDG